MNEKLPELVSLVRSKEHVLWTLQNSIVQLSVEPANAPLRDRVRADLLEVASAVSEIAFEEVAESLKRAAKQVDDAELAERAAKALLGLVDALVALSRDEGPAALEAALAAERGSIERPAAPEEAPGARTDSDPDLNVEDLRDFYDESRDNLEAAESGLLEIEKSRKLDSMDEVFRAIHSIKGGAQYVGLREAAALAHKMETVLGSIRDGRIEPGAAIVSSLLHALDGLANLLSAAMNARPSDVDADALISKLSELEASGVAPRRADRAASGPGASDAEPGTGEATEAEALERLKSLPASGLSHEMQMFATEYREHMDSIQSLLVEFDALCEDTDLPSLVRREIHSVKGIAGFIGLPEMEVLASALESALTSAFRRGAAPGEDVRTAVASSIGMLEEIFRQFHGGGKVTVDLSGQLRLLEESGGGAEVPTATPEVSGPRLPLAASLLRLMGAVRSGEDGVALDILDAVGAMPPVGDALSALRDRYEALDPEQRATDVLRLIETLPADMAFALPGSAEDFADPGDGEDLEALIVHDDHDQELVEIYLDTASQHIELALRYCQSGALDRASEELSDLAAAAHYMGYEPLEAVFAQARSLLATGPSSSRPVARILETVREEIDALRLRLAGPDWRTKAPQPAAERGGPATALSTQLASTSGAPALPLSEEAPIEADFDSSRGLTESQTTLRVDAAKIDDLMNMVAELVVNRSSFMVLGATVRQVVTRLMESGRLTNVESRDLRNLVNRYDEATTDLGRVSNQLQEGVMKMRMLPLKTLFARVPRVVRDLAVRERRRVRVIFSGEDTELDKTVIELLSDPLVHMVRNAVSHGIEDPAERVALGKSAEARLLISARHQGNMVTLDVEDDGRGIDLETVRQRLQQAGAMSAQDASRLSERELLSALFLPGFSTARQVTDVSGRGVGLDVVKGNLEAVGGSVEVFTEKGRYCRFSMRIPLTMAIMQALLVRAVGEIFSIPVAAVIQAVKLDASGVSTVENQEVITVRDKVIPLVRISRVFSYAYHADTGQLPSAPSEQSNASLHVVVIQGEGREIGLVVDELMGSQDIVIKSLEDELADARGVAGAAILGDGSVTLILDVAELQKIALDSERMTELEFGAEIERFRHYLRNRAPELPPPQLN